MNLRRVYTILSKDLKDAFRDGRVLVLLLLPIGLAIFYNATVDDEDTLPKVPVAVAGPDGQAFGEALTQTAGKSVEIEIKRADDADEVRKLIADEDADLGAVVDGDRVQMLLPEGADPTAQGVAALFRDAAGGQRAGPEIQATTVPLDSTLAADTLGARTVTVLIAIVMLACFVALMVVPIQTAEELETGTFGALRLAATGTEILAAKALAGCLYSGVGVVLTAVITDLEVDNMPVFVLAAVGFVVSMVGFGLLLGLMTANSNAINTYGGFALIPFLGLAVAVLFVNSGTVDTILDFLPFSQATRLMADSLTPDKPFDAGALAWIVIAAWSVVGYALLARFASRREL